MCVCLCVCSCVCVFVRVCVFGCYVFFCCTHLFFVGNDLMVDVMEGNQSLLYSGVCVCVCCVYVSVFVCVCVCVCVCSCVFVCVCRVSALCVCGCLCLCVCFLFVFCVFMCWYWCTQTYSTHNSTQQHPTTLKPPYTRIHAHTHQQPSTNLNNNQHH